MMNQLWLALEGGFHVLLAGMVLGAGLPLIFSLGIRALSYGVGGDADIVNQLRKRVIELQDGDVVRDQAHGVYGAAR